jgi:hypothetical protein
MDYDTDMMMTQEDVDDSEDVPELRVTLVGEQDLEGEFSVIVRGNPVLTSSRRCQVQVHSHIL